MTDAAGEVVAAKKKRGCGFWAAVGLGGLVLLYAIGDFSETKQAMEGKAQREAAAAGAAKPADAGPPIVEISADTLQEAFAANEVAAKQKYGGSRLKVSGTIRNISLDYADEPVVTFHTGEALDSVIADFDKADAAAVAGLAKGQKLTVICDKLGEVMGSPMLDDCTLVPAK